MELENGSLLGLVLDTLQLFKVLFLQLIELFKLRSLAVNELLGEFAAPGLEEGEVLLVAVLCLVQLSVCAGELLVLRLLGIEPLLKLRLDG